MRKSDVVLFASFIALSACVSSPKDPNATFADKLNGQNYQRQDSILVPVLERNAIERQIYGKVFCGEGLTQTPATQASVQISRDGKTVGKASTDLSGKFSISGKFSSDQKYELSATAKCGSAKKVVSVAPQSLELPDINLMK